MSNQSCPICTSKHRREIDSEIIYQLDQKSSDQQILVAVAEFCASRDILIQLDLESLKLHLRKHPLVGVIGAVDVRGGNIVQLPSGERIDVSDTKSVLRLMLIEGLTNVLTNPGAIGIKDTLRIADLLLRPDPGKDKNDELDELKALILGKMRDKPPALADADHPYALPSNVGKPVERT